MNNFHNSGAYASFFYAIFYHKQQHAAPRDLHRAAFSFFDTLRGAKPRLRFYI